MSRNSLLPFTSTRCTASTTLSSLSDPQDASGFQKACLWKKGRKKYQVEYLCQLLPRVLQAHYQSPRSRLSECKMVNISVQKASPFTGLQHPLSSEQLHAYVAVASLLLCIAHQQSNSELHSYVAAASLLVCMAHQ